MWRSAMLILVSAAVLQTTPARADDATQTSDDVRCLVVAFTLANSQDAQSKEIGGAASAYYLGKLDGRTPDLDLEARLREEIPKVTPDNFMSQLQACGGPLKARFDQVKAIGDRLKAEFGTLEPPPAVSRVIPPQ
jgi:hypothetical protein